MNFSRNTSKFVLESKKKISLYEEEGVEVSEVLASILDNATNPCSKCCSAPIDYLQPQLVEVEADANTIHRVYIGRKNDEEEDRGVEDDKV